MYKIRETPEAIADVSNFAIYQIKELKNPKAADDFLNTYDEKIKSLATFPFGYRGISFEYRGYEIRMKPYNSYNIFFVVDSEAREIVIVRVLKQLQDWEYILSESSGIHRF